ncbi:MAG TPA: hypothetical protein VJX74_05750 [Blastocatellia bacterium]|nr:hypothetical protein [Blastocatellia bacterium]
MRKIRAGLIGAGFVGPLHVEIEINGSRATRTCLMNRFGGTLMFLTAIGKGQADNYIRKNGEGDGRQKR